MSLDDSARLSAWIEQRLDELKPKRLTLTFFGGEPLLNMPVVYDQAERAFAACQKRGVTLALGIITNGLLLTEELVDRLLPYGLGYVKVTLDGDRDTHNRMRPLRGGQGTFDRIIENVRKVAGKVRIAVGGNFDADSVASYPALLDFLKEQDFADKLAKVAFKPVVRERQVPKNIIPLTVVTDKPLNGTCMTAAGSGGSSICDSCQFVDEQLSLPAGRNEEARVPDRGRRPHGAVRDPQAPRLHHRPERLDLRVPGIHGGSRRCRRGTSTTGRKAGGCRRRSGSNTSRRGTSAETARLFRCARAAAPSPRTPSLAT